MAHKGGNIAKQVKDSLEKELGELIVTKNNKLNYEYIDEKQIEINKNKTTLKF